MSDLRGSEPLEWPVAQPRTDQPIRSKFYRKGDRGYYSRNPWSIAQARRELEAELERLGADNALLSTNVRTRQDGLPYSNAAEPDDSGVAVYFDLDGDRQVIAIDRYDRVACNIYAVARTINALRQIDRDGGPSILAAAVSGFRALPEKGSGRPWWDVLGVRPDDSAELIRNAYRARAKIHHPDRGGDSEAWVELQDAWRQAQDAAEVTA